MSHWYQNCQVKFKIVVKFDYSFCKLMAIGIQIQNYILYHILVWYKYAGSCHVCHTIESLCFFLSLCWATLFATVFPYCIYIFTHLAGLSIQAFRGLFFNSQAMSLKLCNCQVIWSSYKKTLNCLKMQKAIVTLLSSSIVMIMITTSCARVAELVKARDY